VIFSKNKLSLYLDAKCSSDLGQCQRVGDDRYENRSSRLKGVERPMSGTITKPRKRLTREESQAQTRAKLMTVGREHFLRHGLGGAVAEKIAEDAGYSRGALYSNFDGKEDQFLAVIREEQDRRMESFRSIFKKEPSAKQRLRRMREAIADLYTDPDWIVLRAEFEAGALRNERIRRTFVEVHREQVRDGGNLIRNLARSSEIHMGVKPNEFIMIILNLPLQLHRRF
jgi:TetR/AcrR family transcriptional regulator, transcriptional repressor of aconitase